MSSVASAVVDSSTMVRRELRHTSRNPGQLLLAMVVPLIMLLLFNYAFGGALDTRGIRYIDFVVPGIILMAVSYAAQGTAIAVNTDMTEGIIDRFRTMAIARSSVLIGHVVGSTLRQLIGVAIVVVVALAIGFRPTANVVEWVAAIGLVALALFAVAWLSTAFGLLAKNPAGASSMTFPLALLPFLSGAFAPTDSMPGWLRAFAANQPMTQVIEALRSLLLGGPMGNHAWLAIIWCCGIALVGAVWAGRIFSRQSAVQ
ncbi:ABC transporter permease [Nocardia transvalensis]|uniref:ABC transporter permease n=1 Tax=Nocardia transvalensis TaxID=37333 RepID=UPI001895A461|nr:ABC transporter permease [Nocardia transvalensis]MBF6332813.1 ABC transporter permease [Nocardia transvalensis]